MAELRQAVTRRSRLIPTLVTLALTAAVIAAGACAEINTDPNFAAAIAIDTLPFPSIVANDTLRDSLGVARPLHGSVFNIEGDVLSSIAVAFRTPDSGAVVDSTTGYVVADSARSTPVRIIAAAGTLQSAPDTLYIVPAPDTVIADVTTDSLLYSLTDTTANLSSGFNLQLGHRVPASQALPVRSYLVSYQITYPSDPLLAQLVTRDGVRRSTIDTTDAAGKSQRRIRLRPLSLTSVNDSVIVIATVRYRGVPVAGSPVRFVLQVKPHP